ncbi:cupin domain-containing protein [Tropicibacter sp. Alg240-R139]|uniref:cupin domain-containing protein n=1 Tax=Tropicibacter sp. Alg240-R139 TaxID=2305991 RepID=UPI0013E09DFF|nr:cupin domain-containing protein [Tropicibacter sp. Alg240-R139]
MADTDNFFNYPSDVDNYGFDWGRLAVTLAPQVNGAKAFSAAVVQVPPGKGHDRHNHPGSEEIIFIIKGTGAQMVEDEDGTPHTKTVGPGCTVFIPESRFHSTLNTGDELMEIFVVYAPAGPEELLKELPDFHVIPKSTLGG